ncbi:hypothetical protein KSP39_PZI022323 [Platanthera zijinensis]|uniref:DDE Tnp4 domain-containing protein n=1 Tax=Platanthera zijinensis TaxID=2320716 RepID=A0AAP0AVJ5_9ASPA
MPFFKDCIGAIDGTHVHACIPVGSQVPYIGRRDNPTQNVMPTCDFNMCFTFVMAGWEGSAHDSRIFNFGTSDLRYNFPHPPPGKYYLVDSGYPLQRGYLKPYQDTRPDDLARCVEGLRRIDVVLARRSMDELHVPAWGINCSRGSSVTSATHC